MSKSMLTRLFNTILSFYAKGLMNVLVIFFSETPFKCATVRAINKAKLYSLINSFKSCGAGLQVQFPITITEPAMVELGDKVSIAAYVHIWGEGKVKIGNRVMIGAHSCITSLTHNYKEEVMFETLIRKHVFIENDVWIGSNCTILPGVKIGKGAVIGAGAVVTKDVQPNTIVAGVPAIPLKARL